MAKSKVNPKRKKKLQQFKQKAKKMSEQKATPKTHVIPQTEWNSQDVLDVRGDILEALETQAVALYEGINSLQGQFQRLAQAMNLLMQDNIKKEKIKLTYKWNNGETLTDEELVGYQNQLKQIEEERKRQQDEYLKQLEAGKKLENAAKTGLVGPDGSPVGTTQDLDAEDEKEEGSVDDLVAQPAQEQYENEKASAERV